MKIVRGISALIFLAGCLALLVGFVGIWTYAGAACVKAHWSLGTLYLVATFAVAPWCERFIRVPFLMWWELWTWGDALVLGRPVPPS